MLNKIVQFKKLSEDTYYIKFNNPRIAVKRQPGQFLILRVDDKGERIPLTIAGSDSENGFVEIFFQVAGATTKKLSLLKEGDVISDVSGPLGKAAEIKKFGTVLCVAGGVGTAIIYPIAKALKETGNKLIVIEGARTKKLMILENELSSISDEFYPATNDGSYGVKGFVTDVMKDLFGKDYSFDICYSVGPVPMMKAVSGLTKEKNLKTIVSLNPIMIDGTGMCGSCRCIIDGKTKFACVDGPDFDGHKVDFNELSKRLKPYIKQEQISKDLLKNNKGKTNGFRK